ncbi:hypothetical protein [Micromonospora sp. NBC_01813]|uniref:hypothetical protein n=1 Tax=Micromonospora sp. NBC_01813 TaxID=2975988 RepID=UPI002DD911A7|nr:hypothetical protein [Micromonospora sp. NBC_01813]WSA11586.1 hypothetical protein OG958_12825 [Micromonospora sp. NBC_01813]
MTDNHTQLPPDVIGHMASLQSRDESLDLCNSCLRALLYGALAHLGSAGVNLVEGDQEAAGRHISAATTVLLELVKADFEGATNFIDLPDVQYWRAALLSFYQARVDHYCDPNTGAIRFDPHDDASPAGAPA